jgi:hypothetical protein
MPIHQIARWGKQEIVEHGYPPDISREEMPFLWYSQAHCHGRHGSNIAII